MKKYNELSKAKYKRHFVEEKKELQRMINKYGNLRTIQRNAEIKYNSCGDEYYREVYDTVTEQMNEVHFEIVKLNGLIHGFKTPFYMLTPEGIEEEKQFRQRMYELGLLKQVKSGRPKGYHHDEETKRKIGEGKRRAAMLKNINKQSDV